MKPQCKTAAQCHKELARAMEQFGITDSLEALESKYVTYKGQKWEAGCFPVFDVPECWSFAVAEVEGNPVFIGDKLWYHVNGNYFEAFVREHNKSFDHCSWNPPKPKTIMVEMRREVAEIFAACYNNYQQQLPQTKYFVEIIESCAKATNLREDEQS